MLKRLIALAAVLLCLCTLVHALADDDSAYFVEVDVMNQITTVYRTSDQAIVRQMICSTGTGTKTPLGTFRLETPRPSGDREPWYYIGKYGCYVKYPTRIKGSILFHSLPYAEKEMSSIDQEAVAQLGTKASHGCVRLRWEDAEWIAKNCPEGTEVRIYNGAAKREALRQRLLVAGYVRSDGQTYDQYLSTAIDSDNAFSIGRGATGDEVTALQRKLMGLGFMSGEVTGEYDEATVVAVMRYQASANLTVNGVTSRALSKRIMADGDAVAEYATLSSGCEGTLVAKFQRVLKGLGFYGGEIDGVYGDTLTDAVTAFCDCMGIDESATVSPATRSAAYQLLDSLNERFGPDGFRLNYTAPGTTARVRRNTALYQQADTSGSPLTELPAGTVVRIAGRVGRWRRVKYGGWTGYIPGGRLGDVREAGASAHWGRNIPALGETEMDPGDMGDGVLALNRRLAVLGYYTGDEASLYSLATARAVEDYQIATGLELTDSASAELQRAIASQSPVTEPEPELVEPVIEGCEPVDEDADDAPEEITIEDDSPRPAWLRSRPVGI